MTLKYKLDEIKNSAPIRWMCLVMMMTMIKYFICIGLEIALIVEKRIDIRTQAGQVQHSIELIIQLIIQFKVLHTCN